jgi:NAD(P)-dependent dehydrogenase (short-subunit alcohol dehydrogenase family)
VNLGGLMLATQLAFEAMDGEGAIVNVSSVAAFGTAPYSSPDYAAAKAAVVRLTASLAEHEGVRVNCICPDWVDTPAVQRSLAEMTPEERAEVPPLVPAEEIADIVLDLIRDDSAAGRVVVRWANETGPRVLA